MRAALDTESGTVNRWLTGSRCPDLRMAVRLEELIGVPVTPTVTKNVTVVTKSDGEGVGGDLGFDRLREERLEAKTATSESLILEDHPTGAEPTVTKTVTRHVTAVTRKRPSTHCPGPEESEGAVDAWCRGQKLPPTPGSSPACFAPGAASLRPTRRPVAPGEAGISQERRA